MFGVRIWLTPMHNTSSPAASLRLAWFSPTALDMGVFPPASLRAPASPRRQPCATVVSTHSSGPGTRLMANQTGAEGAADGCSISRNPQAR